MNVGSVTVAFEERLQEIDAYLDLLDALDRQTQGGTPPTIGGASITPQQQKILFSAVYLQLYNLVEATVIWCLDAVCAASYEGGKWLPVDLTDEMRKEWVRTVARTHIDLNGDNRLSETVAFCERLLRATAIDKWGIERRKAGSWDDYLIEEMVEKLGCPLKLSKEAEKHIRQKVRDEKRPLELVRDFRNRLAHGSLSFTECGANVTVPDLRNMKEWTAQYLREIVQAFEDHISSFGFLAPHRRPGAVAT